MNFKDATNTLLSTVSLNSLCEKLGIATQQTGSSTKAVCQFHDDTKPSMELYDNNPDGVSKYYCFSCEAQGNIFSLVKQNKGMTFAEAHTWLTSEYNVTVTRSVASNKDKAPSSYDKIVKNVFEYALEFFKSNQNEIQLSNYLSTRRYNLDFTTKADLCIVGKSSLVTHLNSLEYPVDTHKLSVFDLYENAGLIKRKKIINKLNHTKNLPLDNLYYDHFRNNRLLFPIRTSDGVLKGFSGRFTDPELGPKYLFTKNLNKSNLLYRSEIAFKNIRRDKSKTVKLFVCEGLFDVLRLETLKLHAVSILGANLSENQCKSICDLALLLSRSGKLLEVNLFLDNDSAGVRATASAIKKLFKMGNPGDFEIKVIHSKAKGKVDPDSYLADILTNQEAKDAIQKIEYPVPALYLADQLSISTNDVLDSVFYKDLPYALKISAAKEWNKLFDQHQSEFSIDNYASEYEQSEWYKFFTNIKNSPNSSSVHSDEGFISESSQRLQLAFSIAKSSMARTGTFPANDAEWRRVEMCFTVLETILIDRFDVFKDNLKPIEPLNTIHVSRDIGGDEFREMSLHCVEDLTSHQYVLSELLTARHDHIDGFSLTIPAIRYYSKTKTTITTGEGGKGFHDVILSFAYQIDMEIVEGRVVPQTSGMFRPYFDCWKEFTKSINTAASKMPQVNMVRLDLKRYYDRLKRHVLQNALRDCLPSNVDEMTDASFMSLFKTEGQDKTVEIINWLLEQSFGYEKYNPKTGKPETSDTFEGIPQGPDLSSYLANLVLFKVDHAARKFLEEHKDPSTGYYPAWYARYVDDMVLLAEDTTLLAQLRVVVEDVVNNLELELIAKEQPMPMSAQEFEIYLTQGKALASSGPDGNIELVEIEDIEFIEKIERYEALGLLNNKQLYADDIATIKLKINLAAHATQLRFTDIKKLTKWIWISVIKGNDNANSDIEKLVTEYKNLWVEVTSHLSKKLNPIKCPWEDPLLLALDGLDQAIERNSWIDDNLDENQLKIKSAVRVSIIHLINEHSLIDILSNHELINTDGWGVSKAELTRTYWQKRTNLCWHARQYKFSQIPNCTMSPVTMDMNSQLTTDDIKLSLIRTHITELICEKKSNIQKLEMKGDNTVQELCLLLQSIYLKFSHLPSSEKQVDVLSQISGEIKSLTLDPNKNAKSIDLFNLFLEDSQASPENTPSKDLVIKALHFICNLTTDSNLIDVLSKRWNGLISQGNDKQHYKLIPPLPTIDEKTIYGYSISASQSNEIEELIRLSTESSVNNNDIVVSSDSVTTRTDWQDKSPEDQINISINAAGAGSLKDANNILLSPPNMLESIDTNVLKWVANTYREILKCNADGLRIPTWSNLAMKVLPTQIGDSMDNSVCIISPIGTNHSYPQAFIRNGGMGLRPLQIPNHNSKYWQAGIALTDIMGFTRDLDQYAGVDEADKQFEIENPQTRLLKNSLKKLNGSIYFSKPVSSSYTKKLPATINRTLDLLDNFPESTDPLEIYSYGIISEVETQLMSLRLDNKIELTFGTGLFELYGDAVKITLNRVPLEWFSHLYKVKADEFNIGDKTLRSSCHFWLTLHKVFSNTFLQTKSSSKDKNIDKIQSVILLGCQSNLLKSWLKSVVFESESIESGSLNDYRDIDIVEQLSEWLPKNELPLEIKTLIFRQKTEDNSVKDLGDYYQSLLKDKATQNSFNEITLLGWFTLALIKKKVLLPSNKNISILPEYIKNIFDNPGLMNLFSFQSEIEDSEVWPVDFTLPIVDIEIIRSQLEALDRISPVVVKESINKRFSYDSVKCNFQSDWYIRKWQIDIAASMANDNKPYYRNVENELLSSWTETHFGNKPIYISSCGNLYGQILSQIDVTSPLSMEVKSDDKQVKDRGDSGTEGVNDNILEKIVSSNDQSMDISLKEILTGTEQVEDSSSEESIRGSGQVNDDLCQKTKIDNKTFTDTSTDKPFNNNIWDQLDDIQKNMHDKAWGTRKSNKSPAHIRAALLQLKLNGDFGNGYIFPTSSTEKSDMDNFEYEEMRRQAILTKAINSCEKLGVDLLVLPEYSVQPATIEWLKGYLKNKKISILAGTYRLPNGFSKDKLSDLTNKGYAETVKPYQAVMSLLVPYNDEVICLNRAKKYASAAADELILPHQSEIKPLFTLSDFEQEVLRSTETLDDKIKSELDLLQKETIFSTEIKKIRELIAGAKPYFGIKEIEKLFKEAHIRPLNYLQELICAELFLLTNPTNYLNLASEFKSLCNKFGVPNSSDSPESFAEVIKDIEIISGNLSGMNKESGNNFQSYRRSIIAIPAMTSRKQDYWIFGQGAMLANGCSTIFCNAIWDSHSTGGSCFIGLDSWHGKDKKPFITPYNGWSKGIYYGNGKDTLEKEQSLVVVDIDPLMMSLGSPRPQSLPVPMKLVAHVPIIEVPKMVSEHTSLIENKKYSDNILLAEVYKDALESFKTLGKRFKPDEIINPEDEHLKEVMIKIRRMFDQHGHISKSCKERIDHWKINWEGHPQAKTPALTDWIAVHIPTRELWDFTNKSENDA
ncbi:MAG: DNA primase catalytic core [Colwellia sp.]|jgi:DNA primase catalytic core